MRSLNKVKEFRNESLNSGFLLANEMSVTALEAPPWGPLVRKVLRRALNLCIFAGFTLRHSSGRCAFHGPSGGVPRLAARPRSSSIREDFRKTGNQRPGSTIFASRFMPPLVREFPLDPRLRWRMLS